jgi:hypothetical protein
MKDSGLQGCKRSMQPSCVPAKRPWSSNPPTLQPSKVQQHPG